MLHSQTHTYMNIYTYIYIFPYLELCLILRTILVSLISITPTHSASVRPGLEVFFLIQESVKEIRSKNLELINITIKQKLVTNLKVQNMLCRTALFYN